MQRILVTGCAGFIGYHLSRRLLNDGHLVVGIDNMNDYYDPALKYARLANLKVSQNFYFHLGDIGDKDSIHNIFETGRITTVINLAAQAGVRYSLVNPYAYAESNLIGFLNILEASRTHAVEHLLYASSSSVYGSNTKMPFSVHDSVDHPVSLYAATKKANELMAHSYSHLFNLPTTGLRFFTVYGPWGRPDMALFLFTKSILSGEPIKIFNNGNMTRDFTFVDDIVEGIVRLIPNPPSPTPNWDKYNPDPGTSYAPYRVFNIGNNQPVRLMDFIAALEKHLGKQAIKEFLPLQDGDVPETCADVTDLERAVDYKPGTSVDEGIKQFVDWYKSYYGVV